MQKITPFLWFNNNAEEAVAFYKTVFESASIGTAVANEDRDAKAKGQTMVVTFELSGQQFIALNGGPQFKFTEAVSFVVDCKDQEEIDYYWEALSKGGEKSRCGWLKDKYGLSWQIVPPLLSELLQDKNKEKAGNVMHAMMKMDKIIIQDLQDAYNKG